MKNRSRLPWFVPVFWSAITGIFLVFTVYSFVGQISTYGYALTLGRVDQIRVTGDDEAEGVEIAYHYLANNQRFESQRMRYGEASFSSNWARNFVASHPVGSEIPVFYSARNPGRAVLVKGVEGFDLFELMFLTPFACIGIGMWWAVLSGRKSKGIPGFEVCEEGEVVRLRPRISGAIMDGMIALSGGAFIGSFLVVFSKGFHGPLGYVGAVWTGIFALSVFWFGTTWWRIVSGRYDVVIDRHQKVIWVRGLHIHFSAIQQVAVVQVHASEGEGRVMLNANVELAYDGDKKVRLRPRSTFDDVAARMAVYVELQVGLATDSKEAMNPEATRPPG